MMTMIKNIVFDWYRQSACLVLWLNLLFVQLFGVGHVQRLSEIPELRFLSNLLLIASLSSYEYRA